MAKIVGYAINFTHPPESTFTCMKYDCVADPIYQGRKLLASDVVKEERFCANCEEVIPAIVEPEK